MKKILLVEDDALVASIYGQKLAEVGFEVSVAEDGLAALKQLPLIRPDLVVLDLLVPKLNGADVLRFIREHTLLSTTRVVVFSNMFLAVGEQILALGVDEMVVKSNATPEILIEIIRQVLERPEGPPPLRRAGNPAPEPAPEKPAPPVPRFAPAPPAPRAAPAPAPVAPPPRASREASFDTERRESAVGFRTRIRRDFFDQIPTISGSVRDLCAEFMKAEGTAAQCRGLEAIARKVGFLTHMTGMAGCHRISQLCSALEALCFELREKPTLINDSTRHTISSVSGLLVDFLDRADEADVQCLSPTRVLLVDDDLVSNRALVFALGRTHLKTSSVGDPLKALLKLRQNSYDIVLLDINLPNMDGLALRERMRELPLHQDTPVIFLTSYSEFAERARSVLTANDDLIAKPVIPIELAVKVTAHVLKRRLPAAKS